MGQEKGKKLTLQFSAGGAVYKKVKGKRQEVKVLWLVARSKPSKEFPLTRKSLPKGWIDDAKQGGPGPITRGERKATEVELEGAALREVKEEGGVGAKIVKKIGTEKWFFTLDKDRIFKFVTYYLMEWVADLPEGFDMAETAEIYWLSYDEAYRGLSYSSEKKILKKAKEILEQPVQGNLLSN